MGVGNGRGTGHGKGASMTADWREDCLRWRGVVLTGDKAHWCHDWDGLPVDETCREFESCTCFSEATKPEQATA